MTKELTPQEVLVDLINNDTLPPVDPESDPEAWANLFVQRLTDSGFAIVDAREQTGWQPIETATKGRDDLIDVWCVSPDEDEPDMTTRLTDVFWYVADEILPHTGWARITDDGNVDFVEHEARGPCGLPAWRPTHWMQRPTPPAPQRSSMLDQPPPWRDGQ